ncbi:substrate-binding periplasmic protein [Kiloniella sp. b19]|uniref:substrate-binding periplasmic protein n=1 Tax=Kiloniella sp. GXU_MW_B19 TaxID=3141326 RepID=UPI0031D25E3D
MSELNSIDIYAVHFPPYSIFENETVDGQDVETVSAAFEAVGIEVVYRTLPWNRAYNLAVQGKIPALLSCLSNKEREEFFWISDPISYADESFISFSNVVPKSEFTLKNIRDYKIGVINGYAQSERLKELGFMLDYSNNEMQTLMKLRDGRVDIVYNNTTAIQYLIREWSERQQLWAVTVERTSYHLCLSRDYPNAEYFFHKFTEGFDLIRGNGIYAQILGNFGAN